MKTILYKASERGKGDYVWLKSNYYFSFGQYDNPKNIHFGALRVLNDYFIAGGAFPNTKTEQMDKALLKQVMYK